MRADWHGPPLNADSDSAIMNRKMKSSNDGEDDFVDTLGEDLPEGMDRLDPLFQQAYKEVMKERINRVQEEVARKPRWISGHSHPYRPEIARRRRMFSRISIAFVIGSFVSYSFSCFVIAAFAGALAIVASLGLAAFLLGEVLFGCGEDRQSEYLGTNGPSREYSFRPFIDSPALLFALVGNVIASVVLGYAEVYGSLAAEHWIVFSKTLDPISSLYFSLVTFATVGYGDFYPDSPLAKLLVCTEIIIALFILAVVLATSTSWVLSRREELASERKAKNASEMQRVEAALKNAGVGLYQDKSQLLMDVLARMDKLKVERHPG